MADPSVSVRWRRGRVNVTAAYSPGPGTYVDKEPVIVCDAGDLAAIGRGVLEGLQAFVDGGDMPDWNSYCSPMLAAAAVSSWSELERGSRACVVSRELDRFLIRGDDRPQWLPLSSTANEIGTAVLAALGSPRDRRSNG